MTQLFCETYATPVNNQMQPLPTIRKSMAPGGVIAEISLSGYRCQGEDIEASPMQWANLYAAAPKLLEALEYAYKILGDIYDGKAADAGSALQPCADAIAAAKGE